MGTVFFVVVVELTTGLGLGLVGAGSSPSSLAPT